jgi:hypothetical protein
MRRRIADVGRPLDPSASDEDPDSVVRRRRRPAKREDTASSAATVRLQPLGEPSDLVEPSGIRRHASAPMPVPADLPSVIVEPDPPNYPPQSGRRAIPLSASPLDLVRGSARPQMPTPTRLVALARLAQTGRGRRQRRGTFSSIKASSVLLLLAAIVRY